MAKWAFSGFMAIVFPSGGDSSNWVFSQIFLASANWNCLRKRHFVGKKGRREFQTTWCGWSTGQRHREVKWPRGVGAWPLPRTLHHLGREHWVNAIYMVTSHCQVADFPWWLVLPIHLPSPQCRPGHWCAQECCLHARTHLLLTFPGSICWHECITDTFPPKFLIAALSTNQ